MIDEHNEELAAMYALGVMEPAEARAFEAEMRSNPELRKFVDDLLHCSAAMVHAVPVKAAPSKLRDKVLSEVAAPQPAHAGASRKVVPFFRPAVLFPWAIAAGFMVICGWLAADRGKLLSQISELQTNNDVCQMRIALLDPMDDKHGAATIVWDSSTQTGVLEGDMPRPAANEDYQLWVVGDHPQPVDAGLVNVDEKGEAKATFRLKQKVSPADQFAITVEKKGGMPQPQGTMVMKSGKK